MTAELEPAHAIQSDRGGTVLALGIVSLLAAFLALPLGILPWIMGSRDLRAMRAGDLDPSGRRTTQAGRVLGIVGTIVALLVLAVVILSLAVPDTLTATHVIEAGR